MASDEKLVEALAEIGCRHGVGGFAMADCEDCQADARAFIERHRLVSLPEQPTGGWEVELNDGTWAYFSHVMAHTAEYAAHFVSHHHGTRTTGRIRPVYIIPGDPIDVRSDDDA